MKNKIKLSMLFLGMALTFSTTYAADPVTISAPEKVKDGNSFEKELTPLLREISKKKSQLELRKLERELAKIDEEEVKAQLELEAKSNPQPTPGTELGPMGGMIGSASPMGLPNGFNPQQSAPSDKSAKPSAPAEEEPVYADVKVLMIYGFDGDLSAKIATGGQGGYVVKKGDIMPDGRKVTKIASNFIEVKPVKGKLSKGVSRIFVSGEVVTSSTGAKGVDGGGNQDATQSPPPMTTPQAMKSSAQTAADSAKAMDALSPADKATVKQVQDSFKSLNQGVKQVN